MQMLHCPNCGKFSGFKRALGFGTFFIVVITCGLWLLILPLYPARCINCGLMRRSAAITNFSSWFQQLNAPSKALVILLPILVFLGLGIFNTSPKTPTASQPPDNIPSISTSIPTKEPSPSKSPTDDHELHLLPNFFGRGAISDGRTYSIALIASYQDSIPPNTDLLFQGIILGQIGNNVIALRDEESPEKTLVCGMTPEEFQDVNYLYPIGSRVRVFGTYENATAGIPLLQKCTFSDPIDKDKVVRPQSMQTVKTESQPEQSGGEEPESPEFRWPTDGLPAEIVNALGSPDLAPNAPGSSIEVILAISGQKQILSVGNDCGSAGCGWTLSDATTRRYLIPDELGALRKTQNVTDGYYDLLVEGKSTLVLYRYQGESYREAQCYARSGDVGSSAIPSPCGKEN